MKMSSFSTCKSCGAPIMWLKTDKGKWMPVDIKTEQFYPDPVGAKTYIMNDGHTMRGTPAPKDKEVLPCVASGNVSHFATCPNASQHRRRR